MDTENTLQVSCNILLECGLIRKSNVINNVNASDAGNL